MFSLDWMASGSAVRSSLRQLTCVFAGAAMLCGPLAGCAQMGGGSSLTVAADDPCGAYRTRFNQSQSFFTQEIVMTTVTGGLIGAGSGALIGAAAGGGRGALIGAGVGLAAGLAAGFASGYWAKLQQQSQDNYALATQVNGDLTNESTHMSETAQAFSDLRYCRFNIAQQIKGNARRGVITRDVAQSQLAQEHGWFDEEIAAAQQAGLNMQKRDDQFQYAAQQLPDTGPAPARRTPTRTRAAAAQPSSNVKVAATETIPQKRNSFETSVKQAQAQSTTAFSLDTNASWLLDMQIEPAHA